MTSADAPRGRPDRLASTPGGSVPFDAPRRDRYLVFGRPDIREAEIAEVVDTLRSGWVGTGPKVAAFEEDFARYTGARHAVALGSCTAGLQLGLRVAGLGPGDEVLVPALTFAATGNAVVHSGATPVLVDADPRTGNLDLDHAAALVTSRTRAVVPVHFAGRPCDMDAIMALAERHSLTVIEDCAHAIESTWRGRHAGTFGLAGVFSFYVTKNVMTAEGGMLLTADDAIADRVKRLALHGLSADAWERFSDRGYRHYEVVEPGFKLNMTDLQASLGRPQLARVEENLQRRYEIWERYDDALADLPLVRPLPEEPGTRHARHLYTVLLERDVLTVGRDEVMAALHRQRIGTGVHYRALHLHPYYRDTLGVTPADLPAATDISERTLSLPLGSGLTDGDVADVVDALRRTLHHYRR
jgi:dTDP-4-amino-4,6-dideoxygalactose transaminase